MENRESTTLFASVGDGDSVTVAQLLHHMRREGIPYTARLVYPQCGGHDVALEWTTDTTLGYQAIPADQGALNQQAMRAAIGRFLPTGSSDQYIDAAVDAVLIAASRR